jgi:hypothetical protein
MIHSIEVVEWGQYAVCFVDGIDRKHTLAIYPTTCVDLPMGHR